MKRAALKLLSFAVLCLFMALPAAAQGTAPGNIVRVLTIDGAIGPAISDHVGKGLAGARDAGVHLVVLQMDTPGGLDLAMRDIIQAILDADVPVVTYVFPQGARAASAGTYILYASHIAAMAPATNLGAATPVQIGLPSVPGTADEAEEENAGPTAMENKIINDARAYIRGLAERNGRNAEWAETAVTEAASLAAREALAENVIDIVAADLDDLLAQLDGREVSVRGNRVTLATRDAVVEYTEMDWRSSFLMVLTNPSLIIILGMIGMYGLILEFYSPGFGFGGVVGVICLLLAGYGLQLLPINYAGLGLILLGLGLMIAEAFIPSFGVLGFGGIVAFIIGGVMLVDTGTDVFQVSLPLLAAIGVFAALVLVVTLRMFGRIRHAAPVSGIQNFIGRQGESVAAFTGEGMVKVGGELWQATTDTPLQSGDKVKVLQVDGLHLKVTKI
jgi:membrane-bound serine protease (ClpP class)